MHSNSLAAYREGCKGSYKTRSQAVFEAFFFGDNEYTDRQVLKRLKPYSDDLNYVRPRITEMIKDGVLEECREEIEGAFRVRVCKIRADGKKPQQKALF